MNDSTCYALALSFAIVLCFFLRWKRTHSRLPLPPGPKKLPLVGNLFNMPRERQWEAFQRWSEELGSDIIHLDVAGTSIIVLSSMEAIRELFEKRSSVYSDRSRFPMLVELMGWDFGIGFMKYGDRWRAYRKMFNDSFNVTAAAQFYPQERAATHALLRRLLRDPSDVMAHVRHMVAALIMDVTYGIKVSTSVDDPWISLAAEAMHGLSVATVPGAFLVDAIPALKYLPSWFPGGGFKLKAQRWRKITRALLEKPFEETKERIKTGTASPSFTLVSLHNLEESKTERKDFEEDVIKATAANMYSAGTDTIVGTLGTFILAMIENPEAQRKAQSEIDAVLGPGNLPGFSDQSSLPYVSAVLKEVLRWRNVAPLALPHYIAVDDEYAGYRIPRNSIVMGNTWAILHDKDVYPDPHAFKPERFLLDGKLNLALGDPETAAFGYGRRICPGKHMATASLWITIASMLASFNIEKALDEHGNVSEPSHEYAPGLVHGPLPFQCSITARSSEAAEAILATTAE